MTQGIHLDDNQRYARRSQVLLRTGIDNIVFGDINRTREDIRRHIGNQRHFHVGVKAHLGTVDCIVCGDMEIVQVCRNLISLRDVAVGPVGRGCYGKCVSEPFCLFERLLCPDTGLEVSGPVLEKVHRHIQELQARTAPEEHNFMGVGNIEELFPERPALFHYRSPFFRPVGDFNDCHAGPGEILQGLYGVFDGLVRKDARPCVEIVYLFHFKFP